MPAKSVYRISYLVFLIVATLSGAARNACAEKVFVMPAPWQMFVPMPPGGCDADAGQSPGPAGTGLCCQKGFTANGGFPWDGQAACVVKMKPPVVAEPEPYYGDFDAVDFHDPR
jgi:hypothetical protein